MQFVLKFKFNWSQIKLKKNRLQIGASGIENMLVISIIHCVQKKNSKRHIYEKTFSIPFKINSKPKPILVKWNNYWNLNFSTLYQLWCYLLSLEFFMFIGGVGCWGNHWHSMLDAISIGREAQQWVWVDVLLIMGTCHV